MIVYMDRPQYINWIVKEEGVVFEDLQPLNCYRLSYVIDNTVLDEWAMHIRRHYVSDSELEEDAALNNLSVEEYLGILVLSNNSHYNLISSAYQGVCLVKPDSSGFLFRYGIEV